MYFLLKHGDIPTSYVSLPEDKNLTANGGLVQLCKNIICARV